jgi:uncharacterized protein (TIGR04255 family)
MSQLPANLLPKELKHDSIVETVFEIRFDTSAIPEVFFGRLAECSSWQNFQQRRLPAADIPSPMRRADPGLRFAPSFELREANGQRAVRIGPQVLSFHKFAPYWGWAKQLPALQEALQQLFSKAGPVNARRLGFRYLNALTNSLHGIRGLSDLDMSVKVAGQLISDHGNVNFKTMPAAEMECTVRVATPDFVEGAPLPNGTTVFIDVDVSTPDRFRSGDQQKILDWIDRAHTEEKVAFFRLLTDQTIADLRKD